jgi:predicted NodU family carbamoyl transferase
MFYVHYDNFYYHQNFKEQIEDEFNRTLNEFEHIEPFNRPLLPKQQSSKKFFAMIEILNQFILPKFVNNTSFKKLHSIISCVPQKTHSQQAMTKVKYVLVPDVK